LFHRGLRLLECPAGKLEALRILGASNERPGFADTLVFRTAEQLAHQATGIHRINRHLRVVSIESVSRNLSSYRFSMRTRFGSLLGFALYWMTRE